MSSFDLSWLDTAIPPSSNQSLNTSIRDAIAKDPHYLPLFQNISSYIVSVRTQAGTSDEPAVKKRKLDTPSASGAASPAVSNTAGNTAPSTEGAILTVEGISFSVPARKKFNLVITPAAVSAVVQATGKVEFGVEVDDIAYICCLPVPEKAARQWNFCIIPRGATGLGDDTGDAIVFTIPDGPPKTASGDALGQGHDTSTYRSLLIDVLNGLLKASKSNIGLVEEPKESIFFSVRPQSHRKGERAFHVKAHRGSKEGYLFFLKNGILSAFRKPLVYFNFGDIDSVSYTSITKRTFNLSIRVAEDRGGGDFEFSMIDQEDYTGIDAYVKENRLHDASMAEQRRARFFNVNGKKGDDDGDAAGPGELEKAWEDAEDEEEEDYVPGQHADEGGSDSESGSNDEDDEGSEAGSENMESDDEGSIDLRDELGSEMEDVDADAPKPKRVKRVRA